MTLYIPVRNDSLRIIFLVVQSKEDDTNQQSKEQHCHPLSAGKWVEEINFSGEF